MSGRIIDQARRDAQRFTNAGGFQEEITLSTPSGDSELLVSGLTTGHWQGFDTDGNPVNSTSNHITIAEADLIAANYPYLVNGRVGLQNHKVSVLDKTYIINECHPNQTLGLLVCILGVYKPTV